MQYNYDFEIASLLIMTIILLHFVFIRQFPVDKTKAFCALIISCTLECLANILSSLGLANADLVPQFVNEVLAFAFFAFEGLTSYLLFRYFVIICEFKGIEKKVISILGTLPFVLFTSMVVLTPFIGFFYYFQDNVYYQGFGAEWGYIYIIYYFVLNILLMIYKYRVINSRTKVIILIYTIVAVSMVGAQFYTRGLLLTSVGNAVVVLMLYLALQNPGEMLDPVTGLGNESAFLVQLNNLFNHNTEAAIITIHLRKFHNIQSMLGIKNSNMLLGDVGSYLSRLCGRLYVFHTQGDMFTIVADTKEQAEKLQIAIMERFGQDWNVQQNQIVLGVDVVIQHYPQEFGTSSEFMGIRQFVLEDVATAGSHAVLESDASVIERYHRKLRVELAVSRAIREKSFEVYYQPIYSLREKRIVSLEALVRLHDDELGYIPPDEFIPMVERDGNIMHIGGQVLEECCKFLSHHVLSSVSLGIRTIHVNVSTVQCLRQNLSETILPILERYHIPPSMITLEITENTAIRTPELMERHMNVLGEKGISFAMDDYGSGNSNCSYLIRFPFQEVKIDKDIVWASFENDAARTVLENEIRTIQKLGLPLVVEGIETKEQSDAMEQLGVDYIQGYFYGKPLPEDECLRYIRRNNFVLEEYARAGMQ